MVQEAYSSARFVGQNMPHIDPLKEVKAVVEMLNAELISNEQATEKLNAGDWYENHGKLTKEKKKKGPGEKNENSKVLKVANDG